MTKYLKIPGKAYPQTDINRLEREQDINSELDYSDRIVKKALEKGYEPVRGVLTWMRIPYDDLIECSYDAWISLEHSEDEFDSGNFTSSILYLKDNRTIPCAWSVEQLEDFLIKNEIVHPSIKKEKEIL